MGKMARVRTQLMTLILHISCVLCVVIVGAKDVTVYKDCPVSCTCKPDVLSPEAWALEADSEANMLEVPQLTPNITTLFLMIASSIEGFAFSSAPLLRRLTIYSAGSISIHQDAFQSLPNLLEVTLRGTFVSGSIGSGLFSNLHALTSLNILNLKLERVPSDILCELSHIEHLSLGADDLPHVSFEPCVSGGYPNLSSLTLSFNPLKTIQADDFYGLRDHDITELFLASCELTDLRPGLFQHLPRLTRLDISDNKIKFLPSGVLESLPNLIDLSIGTNELTSLSIDGNCPFMPVLERFSFSDSVSTSSASNESFPRAFLSATSLDSLDISLKHTIHLDESFFASLTRSPVTKLSLSLTFVTLVSSAAFDPLTSLQKLKLTSGTRVQPEVMHNMLISIGRLPLLHNLTIRSERIVLDNLTFEGFLQTSSLEYLDLSSNKIERIKRNTFLRLPRLTTLKLSSNLLTVERLDDGVFYGLHSLHTLDLSRNKLTGVPESNHFEIFASLRTLDLSENEIHSLYFFSINVWSNLKELDLRGNNFAKYEYERKFNNFTDLKTLSLATNHIYDLNPYGQMLSKTQMLKELYLNDNFIASWRPEVFRSLQKLTDLTLASNMIVDVPQSAFRYLTSLTLLDLSHNPLACTCQLLWFKHWITTSDVYLLSYTIKEKYTCASPEQEQSTALIDVQLTVDDCASHFLYHLIMGSVSGFVFVCTILSLTYRYRWYIRYYIFLVRSRRRQMYDALVEDETFRYDVYVCYHNTRRHWVINELLPKLEHEAGIQLCLHDRNWLAGPTIMDNIIESIEHSRKTLLLVNNGFAQSGWCREETSLAYHRLIETQRNMLIVVLLEDVQQENMDKLLRSILTKRVYLKYSRSRKKEHRFWKALKAALRKGEHPTAGMELHRA